MIVSIAPWISFTSCLDDKPKTPTTEQQQKYQQNSVVIPEFNGNSAFEFCKKQVDFGPRVPNTKEHDACKAWLLEKLTNFADTVITQNTIQTVYNKKWNLINIVAQFNPHAENRVMLCAHWDSRPRSDEDSIKANFDKGIPGANDGASGVGVLLELARLLHSQKPDVGVDLVLFDGEDIGYSTDGDNFCIGSKYFAKNLPVPKPRYAILLDLVGDKEAQFLVEQTSMQSAFAVVDKVWALGKLYGNGEFVLQQGGAITDDHIPLIEAGIPTIDIIDMELVGNRSSNPRRRYWHTQYDTMENISPVTLSSVSTVLTHLLFNNPIVI